MRRRGDATGEGRGVSGGRGGWSGEEWEERVHGEWWLVRAQAGADRGRARGAGGRALDVHCALSAPLRGLAPVAPLPSRKQACRPLSRSQRTCTGNPDEKSAVRPPLSLLDLVTLLTRAAS